MDVRLPDGTIISNVPEGTSKAELTAKLKANGYDVAKLNAPQQAATPAPTSEVEDQSIFRSVADVPLQVGMGATTGVRMISDAFGANNRVSKALSGVEDYMDGLLSAQAKNDQDEIARIMQEAEDKGLKENVKAAAKAFATAPVDQISNILGTSIPYIAAGLATSIGAVPAGAATAVTVAARTAAIAKKTRLASGALGVVGGAGEAKGQIYETVKAKLESTGVDPDIAEEYAQKAQAYDGKNLDSILGASVLGGVAAGLGVEPAVAAIAGRKAIAEVVEELTKKGVLKEAGKGLAAEAIPEMAQEGQQQMASNIALQREGFDVPTGRGVAGAAALAGMLSAVPGAGIPALQTRSNNAKVDALEEEKAGDDIEAAVAAFDAGGAQTINENEEDAIDTEISQNRDRLAKRARGFGIEVTDNDTVQSLNDKINKFYEANPDMDFAPPPPIQEGELGYIEETQDNGTGDGRRSDGVDSRGDGASVFTPSGPDIAGGPAPVVEGDGPGGMGSDSGAVDASNNGEGGESSPLAPVVDEVGQLQLDLPQNDIGTQLEQEYQQAVGPTVQEIPMAPTIVTEALLGPDGLGISKNAPVRKKILGKDIALPEVQAELTKYANNEVVLAKNNDSSVRVKRALDIQRMQQKQAGVPETQMYETAKAERVARGLDPKGISTALTELSEETSNTPMQDQGSSTEAGTNPAQDTTEARPTTAEYTTELRKNKPTPVPQADQNAPPSYMDEVPMDNSLQEEADRVAAGEQETAPAGPLVEPMTDEEITAKYKVEPTLTPEELQTMATEAEVRSQQLEDIQLANIENAATKHVNDAEKVVSKKFQVYNLTDSQELIDEHGRMIEQLIAQYTSEGNFDAANRMQDIQNEFYVRVSPNTDTMATEDEANPDTSYDMGVGEGIPYSDQPYLDADELKNREERTKEIGEAIEEGQAKFTEVANKQIAELQNPTDAELSGIESMSPDEQAAYAVYINSKIQSLQLKRDRAKKEETSRPSDAEMDRVTEQWLKDNDPNYGGDLLYVQDIEEAITSYVDTVVAKYFRGGTDAATAQAREVLTPYIDRVMREIYSSNAFKGQATDISANIFLTKRIHALSNLVRTLNRPVSNKTRQRAVTLLNDKTVAKDEMAVARLIAKWRPNYDAVLFAPIHKGPQLDTKGIAAINNGDLKGLITHLIAKTKNPVIRTVLRKINALGLTTTIGYGNVNKADASGYYDTDTNSIVISAMTGSNEHTVVHELIHAAISHVLRNKGHKLSRQLTKLFEEVQDQLGDVYGAKNVQEFASELASNGEFQALLKSVKRGNIFTRAIKAIADFLGFPQTHNAFDEGIQIVNDLIDVSHGVYSPPGRGGRMYNIDLTDPSSKGINTPGIAVVESRMGKGKTNDYNKGMLRHIGDLVKARVPTARKKQIVRSAWNAMDYTRKRLHVGIYSTRGLYKLAKEFGLSTADLQNLRDEMHKDRNTRRNESNEELFRLLKYVDKTKNNGRQLADVIHMARLLQIDASEGNMAVTRAKDPRIMFLLEALALPGNTRARNTYLTNQLARRDAEIKYVYDKFNALDAEGKAMYSMMKDRYEKNFLEYEQGVMDNAMRIAGEEADSIVQGRFFRRINKTTGLNDTETETLRKEMAEAREKAIELLSPIIKKMFADIRQIQVYFPLARHGDVWFKVGTGRNGETYFFDNQMSRDMAMEDRQAELDADPNNTKEITAGVGVESLHEQLFGGQKPPQVLKEAYEKIDAIAQNSELDTGKTDPSKTKAVDQIKNAIFDMYLSSLPGRDIRKRYVPSQNKAGFSSDIVRTFASEASKANNQLPRLKYGNRIRSAVTAMWDATEDDRETQRNAEPIYKEIQKRSEEELAPMPDDGLNLNLLSSLGTQAVFFWVMTSPKSAIIQMTQLPIVGFPKLWSKYGFAKTTAMVAKYIANTAIFKSMGVKKWTTDGQLVPEWGGVSLRTGKYLLDHPNKENMLLMDKMMVALGLYETGLSNTIGALSKTPTADYNSGLSKTKRGVFTLMGGLFMNMERISREIMAHSSYELAFDKAVAEGLDSSPGGAAHQRALDEAIELTRGAMFDFTRENKPPVMNNPILRPSFQFMTYPMQMTGYMWDNFKGMLPMLDNNAKKEAAIQFFGTMGMTFLFAGATGFPMYSMMMGLLEGLRELARDEDDPWYDEDDDENPLGKRSLDRWFREWYIPHYFGVGSPIAKILGLSDESAQTLARAVEMGPISAITDMHWGSSVSLDGMFLRDEIMADGAKNWVQAFMFNKMTGALGSMTGTIASGFEDINNGMVDRGLEKIMPAFVRGGAVALRLDKEGAQTRSYDTVMEREFYTTGKLLAQGLGFKSTTVAEIERANFLAKGMQAKIARDHTKMLNKINLAVARYDTNQNETNLKRVVEVFDEVEAYNNKEGSVAELTNDAIRTSINSRFEKRGLSYQGLSVPKKLMPVFYDLVKNSRTLN